MRFHTDGPSIPDILLERRDAGRVVFLCGAGVSLPSGMPTFVGLTRHVIEFFDPPADSDIMSAFRPWLCGQSAGNVPLDQIFNLLHLEYGKDEVNAIVTERLSASVAAANSGREHSLIKRISSTQSGVPQIVTTNFDQLFEAGAREGLAVHVPPAFPDLNFGSEIEGITYLHGRLVESASRSHQYVLSSADFGRAYLSEGWATNFIRHLLERYTVVLVGYKAEDPPIKYLLQGLNHDGQYDRSKLFAFDRGLPEEIEAKWRDRGVTAIAYSDHSDLWKSFEAWADRADDPRKCRSSVIEKCQQDPKKMASHERGQVAHVLRTVQGAKLLSEADPPAHPEWVCVLDASIRSGKPSRGFSDDSEIFDPRAAYGLDDDLIDISDDDRRRGVWNDSLLVWRDNDESPHHSHRLGGPFERVPKRLSHLTNWIAKSIDSPVLAWWAVRQNGLHSELIQQIEWQIDNSKVLAPRARHIWNLILEHHRDPRNRLRISGWFDFKKRVTVDGWNASVLREFRRAASLRLEIKMPFGMRQSQPPSEPWDTVRLGDLGEFEIVFLERHNEDLDVPDEVLPQIFRALEEQFTIASGLLEDIEAVYFRTPSCYPGPENDGERHIENSADIFRWFIYLFTKVAANWPELARAHATTWPATDRFFFSKFKLFAFSKTNVFKADDVANEVSALPQQTWWNSDLSRELLFLLAGRWHEFSAASRDRLTDRILAGPDKFSYWSDAEYPIRRIESAARYGRYLELHGCDLTAERAERLAEIIKNIPDWSDSWAISTVTERESRGGWVETDEKPDVLVNVPVTEVVAKAKECFKLDFASLTEQRPFSGLVKIDPRKALSALTLAGRQADYPHEFWSSMIIELPSDISPRLKRVFLNRLARLPYPVVAELRHPLGRWLEQNFSSILQFDRDLGWKVLDHIVDGFLTAGVDAAKSGLDEVWQGGKVVQRSRRTYNHAINGPIGMCTDALFRAVPGERQEAGSLIPAPIKSRIERLFSAPGEGSDHAVSVACNKLNWLMYVDPTWTTERLLPMLAFDHPKSEPAWNGFLYSGRVPWTPLAAAVKPLLLRIYPWIERFSWEREVSKVAAQWLGHMRITVQDQEHGLSQVEMRSALRAMSDETRNHFIFWLGLVGQKKENGWVKHVIPLTNDDWPKERQFTTSVSVKAWVALLDDTGDSFPIVYEAVKKFLVPIEADDHPFYRFTREISDEKSLTAQFPEVTLDLMDRVTPQVLTRPPYELPKVLAVIAETKPDLMSDPRYSRLIDLVERS